MDFKDLQEGTFLLFDNRTYKEPIYCIDNKYSFNLWGVSRFCKSEHELKKHWNKAEIKINNKSYNFKAFAHILFITNREYFASGDLLDCIISKYGKKFKTLSIQNVITKVYDDPNDYLPSDLGYSLGDEYNDYVGIKFSVPTSFIIEGADKINTFNLEDMEDIKYSISKWSDLDI